MGCHQKCCFFMFKMSVLGRWEYTFPDNLIYNNIVTTTSNGILIK
jgi:hypothetical protein